MLNLYSLYDDPEKLKFWGKTIEFSGVDWSTGNVLVKRTKDGLLHCLSKPAVEGESFQEWWVEGQLHRDGDLPAKIHQTGDYLYWYKHGKIHRDGDKPAIIRDNQSFEWWKNGIRHRDGDKPAMIFKGGAQKWYKNGLLHREGGNPAVIGPGEIREWYENGVLHRADGPAVIDARGRSAWAWRGYVLPYRNQEDFDKWLEHKGFKK